MADIPPVSGVAPIPSDGGRRRGREQEDELETKRFKRIRRLIKEEEALFGDDYHPQPIEEPTAALVEVLDRLRATQADVRTEETTRRHLRGQKYYHDQKPPVVPGGLSALDPTVPPEPSPTSDAMPGTDSATNSDAKSDVKPGTKSGTKPGTNPANRKSS